MNYVHPDVQVFVRHEIKQSSKRTEDKLTKAGQSNTEAVLLRAIPRRASFNLTDIAVGTQTVAVSWSVPIPGDYHVNVEVVCGTAFVGLLSAQPQAGSKTPTGCTLIVANRGGAQAAAAAFSVLAFPL